MSREENKATIRALYAAINTGELARIDEIFSADFVDRSTADQVPGPQGVWEYFTGLRLALPNLSITIEELVAENETVAVRTTWRGTLAGRPEGEVCRTMMQIFHLVDGRIREEWNEGADLL
jgi:predicted SnoaL-like aldol condensation-catalyzing enzyme